jgi:hypothetical protein
MDIGGTTKGVRRHYIGICEVPKPQKENLDHKLSFLHGIGIGVTMNLLC